MDKTCKTYPNTDHCSFNQEKHFQLLDASHSLSLVQATTERQSLIDLADFMTRHSGEGHVFKRHT